MDSTVLDEVAEIFRPFRRFLEGRWREDIAIEASRGVPRSVGVPDSWGYCRLSSLFIAIYLNATGTYRLGDPNQQRRTHEGFVGGFAKSLPDGSGIELHEHAWLQIRGLIIDVTADQFGQEYPDVLVASVGDARYRDSYLEHSMRIAERGRIFASWKVRDLIGHPETASLPKIEQVRDSFDRVIAPIPARAIVLEMAPA